MKRITALLNEKNHYLEKFYALNETELKNFLNGDFDTIEAFYNTREKILEIIKYIDNELDKTPVGAEDGTAEDRRHIKEALNAKDEYVARIIEQDLQVLSCIESAKNSIIHELNDLKKGKRAVSGYRAPTFGRRVDKEG